MNLNHPPAVLFSDLLDRALREDLGRAGDLTTDAIVLEEVIATATFIARQAGRIAGLDIAVDVLRRLDSELAVDILAADGVDVPAGTALARVTGQARALLTGERVALNFLGRLSGIATATRDLAKVIAHTRAQIVDTRKTTPGLRALEKYAVRVGGGRNHRWGLDDAILIKDNHRHLAGGVRPAVERARAAAGHLVKIEVEVDTLEELRQALALGVDAILLDNMTLTEMATAVDESGGQAVLEASGGIRAETAAAIAETGVDLLSIGGITHSAPALDVALDLEI